MGTPATYEHLAFPHQSAADARGLQRRLEQVESAARLFASGLLAVEVELSWALGRSRSVQLIRASDGSLSVHVWVDLLSARNRPHGVDIRRMTADDYLASFRTGFLHALGRVLYSPSAWSEERAATTAPRVLQESPDALPLAHGRPDPLEWALRRAHPRWRLLPRHVRATLGEPAMRAALRGLFEELEDARVDGLLAASFAGGERQLESRRRYLEEHAASEDAVAALVSRVALALASVSQGVKVGVGGERSADALERQIGLVRSAPGIDGAWRLAEFLVFDLLPVLLSQEAGLEGLTAGVAADEVAEVAPLPAIGRGLKDFCSREPSMDPTPGRGAPGTVVVTLPRVDGGEASFRIDRARARRLAPDDASRQVLEKLRLVYGPRAEEAFASEATALRRALRANWERRRTGRYRSGRHVGIPNLRRYLLLDDMRLFQRLEAPDTFSYYFHLLVDVSYSMLEHQNAAKALAVAYGFTDLLRSFKVPVDVTLYSAGVTELFDHQTDPLERFFGADFGYLLSGTLEMEAVAYAKQKAARISERRKIFVVVTDGTPFTGSLAALGADDLDDYYRETFIPWLRRAGIELLAIGVDCDPRYHERSVCLTETWDAVRVLSDVLEEIVAEAEWHTKQLWV